MSYPEELCQLVIRNMEIIEEAPKVVEHVEIKLFTAINEYTKQSVAAQGNWKGCYELYTDEMDQTTFAPSEWPENEKGWFLIYYTLYHTEEGEDYDWLSNAIGLRGSALRWQFMLKKEFTTLNARELKQYFHEFYNTTPALAELGFLITKNGIIYLPFAFNAESVAEEYPDFDEALIPLTQSLEILFKAHPVFDAFVKSFSE